MAILRVFYFCEIMHPQSFAKIKPRQNFRIYCTFTLSSAKRASCIPLHKLEQTECPDTLFTLSSANTASCSPLKSYSQQNVQILYLHYLVPSEQAADPPQSRANRMSRYSIYVIQCHQSMLQPPPQSRANRMSNTLYTLSCVIRACCSPLNKLGPTECPDTLFTLSSANRASCSPLHNLEPT